jgi:hypothetical protein
MLRSQQKPRFLLAETKPLSEKWPQAIFLINEADNFGHPHSSINHRWT